MTRDSSRFGGCWDDAKAKIDRRARPNAGPPLLSPLLVDALSPTARWQSQGGGFFNRPGDSSLRTLISIQALARHRPSHPSGRSPCETPATCWRSCNLSSLQLTSRSLNGRRTVVRKCCWRPPPQGRGFRLSVRLRTVSLRQPRMIQAPVVKFGRDALGHDDWEESLAKLAGQTESPGRSSLRKCSHPGMTKRMVQNPTGRPQCWSPPARPTNGLSLPRLNS